MRSVLEMPKGWFAIPGVQRGDRTLQQQLIGLDYLLTNISGRSVLDLGCAEGLVSKRLLELGASSVYGISVVSSEIEEARRQCAAFGERAKFQCSDLNAVKRISGTFDVVLLLAILHKLKSPRTLLEKIKALRPRDIIVRTAGATPGYVCDARSGDVTLDIRTTLVPQYELAQITTGPFEEWTGYFKRCAKS